MADKPRVAVRDKRGNITGYRTGDYQGAAEVSNRGGGLGAASARAKAASEAREAAEAPDLLKPAPVKPAMPKPKKAEY